MIADVVVIDGGVIGMSIACALASSGVKRVSLLEKAVGTCLAELIVEGRARTVDITACRPERFAEGRRIAGRNPYAPWRDHVEPTR